MFLIILALTLIPTIMLATVLYMKWEVTSGHLLGMGLTIIGLAISMGVMNDMLSDDGHFESQIGQVLASLIKGQHALYVYIVSYLGFVGLYMRDRRKSR